MQLVRFGQHGFERPAVIEQECVFDPSPLTADIDDGLSRAAKAVAARHLPPLDTEGLRLGAPIARPGVVTCMGMNYAAHAAESGSAPTDLPILFLKPPNTVAGPDNAATLPWNSAKTDWEVELGLLTGRGASYLDSPSKNMHPVAGFGTANDLSERDFPVALSGGQWSKGKASPGFTPAGTGPVTPDMLDHRALRLRSRVTGEPRQDSTTADMSFGVEYLVWHLSQFMALEPGDLILTGTPDGDALSGHFPYLAEGDVLEIEGLGRQRQIMKAFQ
jgi:2,4-diketo-3-deoxy-L-fuconate hydrolase